jgi:hypothetical protein
MIRSCATGHYHHHYINGNPTAGLGARATFLTLLAGATSPANFICDDREAPSSRALSCHIHLSWRLYTLHVPMIFGSGMVSILQRFLAHITY